MYASDKGVYDTCSRSPLRVGKNQRMSFFFFFGDLLIEVVYRPRVHYDGFITCLPPLPFTAYSL